VEKPRFLFIEGSAGAAVAPVVTIAALPDASAACALAPPRHAPPRPRTAWRRALPRPPQAPTPLPPLRLLVTGAEDSTSRGEPATPSLSSSSSSSDDEFSGVAGGESRCCSRSQYSSSCYSRRSRRQILHSFLRAAFSCSRHYTAQAAAQARGDGGSDREASTVTLC
jgi:hypothetical protein